MATNTPSHQLSTGGDSPELPSVDFSRSNNVPAPNDIPDEKRFKVKLKGSLMVHLMTFSYDEYQNIFQEICEMVGEEKQDSVLVHYPIRSNNSTFETLTIKFDKHLAKSLKNFYLTCEEWRKVVVEVVRVTDNSNGRVLRPREEMYKTIIVPTICR